VLHALPGAVIAVDLDDRVVVWNAGAERLFGWRAEEVLGQRLPIVPDDAWDRRRRWVERVFAGEDVEVTTQRLHRDGRRMDVVIRYAVITEDGTPTGTVAVCRDASSQLRAAARFQRSQAELALVRRLTNLVHRVLSDLDLTAVLQAIVEVAVDLVDTSSGVLSLEREAGRFVVGQEPGAADAMHDEVLRGGEPVTVAGSLAVPIQRDDEVIGVLSLHSEVARRRFGPAELDVLTLLADYAAIAIDNATTYRTVAAERERFLRLVEAIPTGLAVVEDGVVTGWNANAALLTGLDAADVLGRPPPIDLEAAADGIEVRDRWLESSRSELPWPAGQLYLLRDLTEQRDLDRAKDLFFAATSHELKTPLTVVKGLASTLLKHWDRMPDDHRVDALQTIERRADNLDRLIERILVGSRVQAGAFEVSLMPVDLSRLIDDMVTGFAAAAPPTHSLVSAVPSSLPLVSGERQALDTILGHLLENAIKYSPDGGTVHVRAEVDEERGAVVVTVEDEGVGIEGDVERLLAPFVQADAPTTRRFGGVGLGLYIVRSLVDALGGDLTAANRPGGGARFSFSVPLWVEDPPQQPGSSARRRS
jgi:PAS domain S-box-containing protein